MKVEFYRSIYYEMRMFGLAIAWGEKDTVYIGLALGWIEVGICIRGW